MITNFKFDEGVIFHRSDWKKRKQAEARRTLAYVTLIVIMFLAVIIIGGKL